MKKPTIIKSYRQLSDASLGLKASAILDALTGNPDFAALEPAVTALMALHDTYAAALVKAAGKESTAIALKNEAREILLEALRLLGHSVEFHCAGSDSKLTDSGFDLGGDGQNVPPLEAPTGFKVTDGPNAGDIRSQLDGSARAVAYSHEYSLSVPDANNVWFVKTSSTAEHVYSNLPIGTRVYFRVAMVGAKKQMIYSEVLSRIVQ